MVPYLFIVVGAIGLSWPFVWYPCILLILPRRRISLGPVSADGVTIIIPCFNEEKILQKKVESVLQMTGSRPIQILIANDGSTDVSGAIADRLAQHHEHVAHLSQPRQGKGAALNAAWKLAQYDIVLITDANAEIQPGAVETLLEPFNDPAVGVVRGRFIPHTAGQSVGTLNYQDFNDRLFRLESDRDMLQVSGGVLQAFRRIAHDPANGFTMTEDWDMTLEARVNGWRVVYVPMATASKPVTQRSAELWNQQVRLIYGTIQTGWKWRRLINPWKYGRQSLAFLSGKLAQIKGPGYILLILIGLWLLRSRAIGRFGLLFIGAVALIGLLLTLINLRQARLRPPIFATIEYVFVSETAAVWAWIQIIVRRGRNWTGWQTLQSIR